MTRQPELSAVLDAVIRDRAVPGIVAAVARGDGPPEIVAVGSDGAGRPLTPDALLPVASVSKLAVALAVLRLAADGALGLDDPLAVHLPEAAAARDGVTLRRMLSHTAGLPLDLAPEEAPYAAGLDWPALGRACLITQPATAPGEQVRYGNVGPGLLALVVERHTGHSFAAALTDLVLAPLGIEGYLGVEPPRPAAQLTGDLGTHEGTALEPYNSPFWRALAIPWGGLITTAAGALALVRAFAGVPGDFLPAALRAEATTDQAVGLGGGLFPPLWWPACPWGLGVELRGAKKPHWTPAVASARSFGHAGGSGALVWHDPAVDVSWAILGTRTFERWWPAWAGIGEVVLRAEEP